MNTQEYLDAVKARHGLKSDYKLAKLLNWSHTRVSNYRNRGGQMDDGACLDVAAALNMNALEVIADIHAHRESDPALREFWKEAAKLARAGFLAGAVLFMGSITYTPPVLAEGANLYIMSNRRRRSLRAQVRRVPPGQRDLFPPVVLH